MEGTNEKEQSENDVPVYVRHTVSPGDTESASTSLVESGF
jgi:hypothetical protein